MAMTAFVISLVSLLCCSPLGILGIIFGWMGLSQIKSNPNQGGKGLATAAIVISILSLVILAASVVWILMSGLPGNFDGFPGFSGNSYHL